MTHAEPHEQGSGAGSGSLRVALWIVAASLGASAFAFGAVEPWAKAWLLVLSLAAATAAFWSVSPRRWRREAGGAIAIPIGLLIVWGALQTIPLPSAVSRALNPSAQRVVAESLPAGGGAALPGFLLSRAPSMGVRIEAGAAAPTAPADAGDPAVRSSLSIYPFATRAACLAWSTSLLFFMVAALVCREPVARYRLLWAIAGWTGLLGGVAIVQRIAWNGKLLWFRSTPGDAMPLGPFVNPNHFAGWVEMGVLVSIGLALAILAGGDGRISRQSVRSALVDREWALPRLVALGGTIVLAVCGVAISGSRGGWVALVAGLAVLFPIRRWRAWIPALAAIVVLIGLAVGLASWLGEEEQTVQTAFFARGTADPSLAMRSDIWGRTFRIVVDHPWTGSGLGTFDLAYASYDREGEWLSTTETHNDYLQLLAEAGIVGFALLLWALAATVKGAMLPALKPPGQARWTTTALAAAIFAMLLHEVIEFNLQIPAVSALFAVVGGALVAATSVAPPPDEAAE